MSIEEQHIEKIPMEQTSPTPSIDKPAFVDEPIDEDHAESPAISTTTPPQSKDWYNRIWHGLLQGLRSPLWLCLLAALLVRIWLVAHTNGVIDGDEALVGIQAQHILRGEHPYYYYGQPYMGSLEAYLMAILFAIFGSSVWMLRAEPILLSLVLVWLTWRFAGALAETAQLPSYAKTIFQTVAALLAAIPPLYDTVLQLRTLGGYIETFVLMILLLYSTLQLTRRWRARASSREIALRWAGIGFIVGVAFWVNLLIVSAILAATVWIVGFCVAELVRSKWTREAAQSIFVGLFLAFAAIPACLLGAAPAIRWGLLNHWANLKYDLQQGGTQTGTTFSSAYWKQRTTLIHNLYKLYKDFVAPRVISGALPMENSFLTNLHSYLLQIGLFCIFATAIGIGISLIWQHPFFVRIRKLALLPLLFGFFTALTFILSTSSAAGLESVTEDFAGRYATPLMLALPFFFATVVTVICMLLYNVGHRRIGLYMLTGKPEDPSSLPRPLSRFDVVKRRSSIVLQVILLASLLTYAGVQAYTYGQADPGTTFQSPSCPQAPASNEAMISYLQQQNVHYAWAISWIGYSITFKTQEGIITADPRYVVYNSGIGRMPDYYNALLKADRPALLTFINSKDEHPRLLSILDSLQITYQAKRFPSQPGTDILVVTQLSQTVNLAASAKEFQSVFHNCL
jgi:hypothetical protein